MTPPSPETQVAEGAQTLTRGARERQRLAGVRALAFDDEAGAAAQAGEGAQLGLVPALEEDGDGPGLSGSGLARGVDDHRAGDPGREVAADDYVVAGVRNPDGWAVSVGVLRWAALVRGVILGCARCAAVKRKSYADPARGRTAGQEP